MLEHSYAYTCVYVHLRLTPSRRSSAVFPVHIGSVLEQIVSIIVHADLRQQ